MQQLKNSYNVVLQISIRFSYALNSPTSNWSEDISKQRQIRILKWTLLTQHSLWTSIIDQKTIINRQKLTRSTFVGLSKPSSTTERNSGNSSMANNMGPVTIPYKILITTQINIQESRFYLILQISITDSCTRNQILSSTRFLTDSCMNAESGHHNKLVSQKFRNHKDPLWHTRTH